MDRLASGLARIELRPTECTLLLLIEANPNVTQSELTRMLDVASANMAPLVARLVKRGLLLRMPVDGRSHGLCLTPSGHGLVAQANRVISEHENSLMEGIPEKYRRQFVAALAALWAQMQSREP